MLIASVVSCRIDKGPICLVKPAIFASMESSLAWIDDGSCNLSSPSTPVILSPMVWKCSPISTMVSKLALVMSSLALVLSLIAWMRFSMLWVMEAENDPRTLFWEIDTGGKGQYTQWVHCELIVGSETIHLAHTQQVNSGHIQKVPTNLPSKIPSRYILVIFKKCPPICPAHTQQVSGGHFQKVPSIIPSGYFLNELPLFFHKVFTMYPEGIL